MFSKALVHLRRQWMGALALFLVLSGGVAYAVDTVGSADVIDNSLLSADLKNNQAVRGIDVRDDALTGADVADQSGVDTCTHGTARFGELCAGHIANHAMWSGSASVCGSLALRLPTLGEAIYLAKNYDVPGIGPGEPAESFWTDEALTESKVWAVDEDGGIFSHDQTDFTGLVCVTTPTN
jgi:hypothetical protein